MASLRSLACELRQLVARRAPGLVASVGDLLGALRHPTRRGVISALLALPALLLLYALILLPFTPGISDIRKVSSEQPAQILSADGRKLAEFKQSNREWVTLAGISPHVIDALIATEDHRFREHFGLDWRRTIGAALNTFSGDRQGGSTLTQQLARNLYPESIGRDPTLTRKIKEAITALKIEAVHSKDEILETYLNTVPFLYNAYGIEMAARTYFDTSADRLDVLQAATLVGMLKGNSYYNPVLNPERSLQRRNIVLQQMVRRGKLDAERFDALRGQPLRIDFERQSEAPGPAPHFARQLRKWLIAWADRNGYSIHGDGLIVRTTIDSRLQSAANQAVLRQGNALQRIADATWGRRSAWRPDAGLVQSFIRESPEYRAAIGMGRTAQQAMQDLQADRAFMHALQRQKTQIQIGFLAIDPRNGHVKAWVGSRDFEQDAFDHVQQARRQPGSTFKPFVYGEAFRQGARPGDRLIDQEVAIAVGGGEVWRPTDGGPPSGESMTLADALARSKNTITAQLMQQVGAARVARLARDLGVRESRLEAVPSLALGTSPVTLKEMVSAYGTIANGGVYREPLLVSRIEDRDGRVIEEFAPAEAEVALKPEVAYTLLDAMRGVIDRGTGRGIRSRYGIRADVAGKTGTTQDNADGWFILMQRQLVAGAWVGFNDGRVTLRSDHWGQGAHSALPVVGDFFRSALRARIVDPRLRFTAPEETGWWARIIRWWRELFAPEPAVVPERRRPIEAAPRPEAPEAPQEPATRAVPEPPESDPLQEKIDQILRESEEGEGLREDPLPAVEAAGAR
ncbi:transglycosylase domain-containing protein [Accumulibacter sp.]|uniref:penicillin-binding protein 1A n=1 Tax=Accumulibacter sp. TaxID=2053492 RepID=UPI0025CE49A9|nr:transglycosylase domain-containing protein [Accumulibacter sp.]MCM8611636.1 transglycosylase domain-containing protein [Accumulibacter sp.]MCM8635658.1 transglycosylase domain-containing protein [Accumulibacter sp.]MCM8639221.1 transglycosylase domain-containing protein [Accumulibacter sp.]